MVTTLRTCCHTPVPFNNRCSPRHFVLGLSDNLPVGRIIHHTGVVEQPDSAIITAGDHILSLTKQGIKSTEGRDGVGPEEREKHVGTLVNCCMNMYGAAASVSGMHYTFMAVELAWRSFSHSPANCVDVSAIGVVRPDPHDREPQVVGVSIPSGVSLILLHLLASCCLKVQQLIGPTTGLDDPAVS